MTQAVTLYISLVFFLFNNETVREPLSWFKAGNQRTSYQVEKINENGNFMMSLYATKKSVDGFGTIMQKILADEYRGKRIRYTATIKTENAEKCGLWMRTDHEVSKEILAMDNMSDRPIRGTTKWQKYSVVLDIPQEGGLIAYGVLLEGTGKIWIDDYSIEEVDHKVPTTGQILRN